MRKSVPFFMALSLLTGCGTAPSSAGYRHITMAEAVSLMAEQKNYIIVDVRTPGEYAQGHIPNAINIPNETIGTELLSQLPDQAQQILVYCRSGSRSRQAAAKLAQIGYTNVVEFGGILDWTGEVVH